MQLIPRELIQTEFLTHETEELEPLSPAIPTLHETLTPPPEKIDSAPEDWGLPIILHTSCSTQRTKQKFETSATVKTKKVEETPAIQTLEIFSEASKEENHSADTIQLVLCASHTRPPLRQVRSPLYTKYLYSFCHPPFQILV